MLNGAVCVVAELSGNHNGSLDRAMELVYQAKYAGADAIKLQTYTAETITMDAPGPWFEIQEGPWKGRRLYDLYKEASTPWEWHQELFTLAKSLGMHCFSTPFHPYGVAFLETLDCPTYKVASFEVVDIPLLECIAKTGKPVIMSTGMASQDEIDLAVATLLRGCSQLVLLHCVSAYPAKPNEMRLLRIRELQAEYGCHVGLSDHTIGHTAAVVAVTLGAVMIEKHLTLQRSDGGPDAAFSAEPKEFCLMVEAIREAEASLVMTKQRGVAESSNVMLRKSLFFASDLVAGETVRACDVRCIRPGHGLAPKELPQVIGWKVSRDVQRGEPVTWNCISAQKGNL